MSSRPLTSRVNGEDRNQAELEFPKLADVLRQYLYAYKGDGTPLYASDGLLDYLGFTLEDFQAGNFKTRVYHPDDMERVQSFHKNALDRGEGWEFEARMRRKDGQYRWFLIRGKPLRDQEGKILRFFSTFTDIEDRKQAEWELQQLVDAVPQRIVVCAADGTRLYANKVVLDFHGCTLEEFVNENLIHGAHPDDLANYLDSRRRGIAQGLPFQNEARQLAKNGQYRWFLFLYNPLKDEQGRIVRWYITATDIEDRKQAENCLQKAFQEIKHLKDELYRENLALKEEIDQASMFEEIVGTSDPLRCVLVQVAKVAPTDSTVLINGETGTGKELIARAIHKRSHRAAKTFVSVNCGAIPAGLIGSELFGHEKGAFTGATQRRLGRFELADGGTLFLDEVGDLPAETQVALLRVLQEQQFERVGGTQPIAVNVRIIAATNRDLKAAVTAGTFRSDLFYRLNVFPIAVPPLRDRKDDIPLLVEYLAERYASKTGKKIKNIQKRTLELFQTYDWPGNIRELQNVIERAVILCEGETLSVDQSWLQLESPRSNETRNGLARLGADQERKLIESALAESRGRIAGPSGAAAKLGIPRSTLETKIRKLGIVKR